MPEWIAAMIAAFGWAMSSLVGRVLVALGIQYVSYSGLDAGFEWIQAEAMGALSSMPGGILQLVGLLKIDEAFAILGGALSARLWLKGGIGGVLTTWVLK